uniref:Mixed lineage kinase domain like pseudokinase n=1 Tax=Otus sunia TaxID=257818 RepID=A0A8C8A922_9STRI
MEIVERLFSVAQAIHAQLEQVKCCKHQCQRLVERIQILLEPVRILEAQPHKYISHQEEELLKKLLRALGEAQKLVMKYSQASWIQKFLRAHSTGEEFIWVNESLEDIAQGLSLLLQAEQKQSFLEAFQAKTCRRQDAEDLRDDRAFLDQVIASKCAFGKPSSMRPAVETSPQLLTRGCTALCRALFQRSHCAVPFCRKVRDIFEKEIQTLKKFESPNILRMYGICIEEKDGSPCFSIVMEYCKHGTLRDVLTKQQHLSWEVRIRMALGAARGLYRLHQTEEKSRLHGCICSIKFLVAGDYCVKLSGFELCETESSIKRKAKKDWKQVSMLAYVAPENLKDINYPYKRPCEIYSFGIVLWEIATSKIPFEGCTPEEIVEKVCNDHYQDPVGEDCPEDLRKVIDQCRAFDPSQRPSAEGKCPGHLLQRPVVSLNHLLQRSVCPLFSV